MDNLVKTDLMNIWKENDIVFAEFITHKINLKIAKELVEFRLNYTNHQDSLLYIDASKVKIIDKGARDHFGSSEGTKNIKAAAIFTNSVLTSFLANFLLSVNLTRIKSKIKLFNSKEKAITWLNQYNEK